jgi:small conductance mechanosensitive channel
MKPELLYDKLYNWVLTVGPRLLMALVALFIGIWFIRLFKRGLRHRMERRDLDRSFQPFLISLIVTAMQVVLLLGVMQILGIQMTIFYRLDWRLWRSGRSGIIGHDAKFCQRYIDPIIETLQDGDNIIAQGQDGIVSSIQLFYTVVVTRELKFNYGFDFEQIKKIILNTFHEHPTVENEPVPVIGVSTVEPDGFKVTVNGWVDALEFESKNSKYSSN